MLIVLNNKCNLNYSEFISYFHKLEQINSNHSIVLCPSNIYLSQIKSNKVILGSQNVSNYNIGPYTGEISATQLKSINVKYTIVGHSERRIYFKEDNNQIKDKLQNLIDNNIIPILCIGEKENENKEMVLNKQLEVLKYINKKENVIIAYEPVWAIGTGKLPTIKQIEEAIFIIKKLLPNNKIIYGGSINENNIDDLKSNIIDGYLLGGLSLNLTNFELFLNKI